MTPYDIWHLSEADIDDYAALALLPSRRASVETHLQSCAACRTDVERNVEGTVLGARVDRSWELTADRVDRPRRNWLHRLAVAFGVADHFARLLAASAAFRLAWFASVVLVVAAGIAIARGDLGPVAFLLLSPLVPVVGVAASYGGSGRAPNMSAFEQATPFGQLRLLLVRTAAVTAASMIVLAAVSLVVPNLGLNAVAWLLPTLALTTCTLALATRWSPDRAAFVVAIGWLLLLAVVATALPLAERPTATDLGALAAPVQWLSLVVLVVSATAFLSRRHTIDLPTR